MLDFFYTRTRKHIDLVNKYMQQIYKLDPKKYKLLPVREMFHDQSKYQEPEFTPYISLTWNYHCKDLKIPFKMSQNLKDQIQEATYHHVKNNRHHPEFHDTTTTLDSINPKDRDKPPEKIVDASAMSDTDVAEMIADWLAMSNEKGTDPIEWAKTNINKRWKFTKEQEDLIYDLINKIWKK
jgi:hypothetical protein